MGLPKARRRPLKILSFLKKVAYPLLLFVVALSDGNWGAAAAATGIHRLCLAEGTEEIEKAGSLRLQLF